MFGSVLKKEKQEFVILLQQALDCMSFIWSYPSIHCVNVSRASSKLK